MYSLLTKELNNCFNNCFLPHISLLKSKIKEHLGYETNIVEICDDCILLNLIDSNGSNIGYRFNLILHNDKKIIRGITKV